MLRNCVNCGAPLHGSVCDYCGTEYNKNGDMVAEFDKETARGVLKIGDLEYDCYIGKIEIHPVCGGNSGRDMSGRLIRDTVRMIHKFEVVEV